MRWNKTCALISVAVEIGEDGVAREVERRREVFCNEMRTSTQSWAAARSVGLHADCTIEVWACEYEGEQVCFYQGEKMDVEAVAFRGETVRLTLARRLSDGAKDGREHFC